MDENGELSLEEQQEALVTAIDALASLLELLGEVASNEDLLADATPEEAATLEAASGGLAALGDEVGSLRAETADIDLGATGAPEQLTAMALSVKGIWEGAKDLGGTVADAAGGIADRGKDKLQDGLDVAGDAAKRIGNQIDQARKSRTAERVLDAGGKILEIAGEVSGIRDCVELIVTVATGGPASVAPATIDALREGLTSLDKLRKILLRQ